MHMVAMEEPYHTLYNIYKQASKFLDQTIPTKKIKVNAKPHNLLEKLEPKK
jgi:hypothetical protein